MIFSHLLGGFLPCYQRISPFLPKSKDLDRYTCWMVGGWVGGGGYEPTWVKRRLHLAAALISKWVRAETFALVLSQPQIGPCIFLPVYSQVWRLQTLTPGGTEGESWDHHFIFWQEVAKIPIVRNPWEQTPCMSFIVCRSVRTLWTTRRWEPLDGVGVSADTVRDLGALPLPFTISVWGRPRGPNSKTLVGHKEETILVTFLKTPLKVPWQTEADFSKWFGTIRTRCLFLHRFYGSPVVNGLLLGSLSEVPCLLKWVDLLYLFEVCGQFCVDVLDVVRAIYTW